MGSAADLNYSRQINQLANDIGAEIAKTDNITVYGAEKDYDSLSTSAARGAKKQGGLTIGVTYGKDKNIFDKKNTDVCIVTGMERGGGREFVLVNSCDAIICVSGGSGTLNEISIAYQSNIPIIVLENTGGWSEKLGRKYLDARKRVKCEKAKTARQAVKKAIKLARKE
jgi:uncharacterized protein (TIGR00725 family)